MDFQHQRNLLFFILLLSILGVFSCKSGLVKHKPVNAAIIANDFSDTVFVNQNFYKANLFLSERAINKMGYNAMEKFAKQIHPSKNYPHRILAKEYEPIYGTSMIKIYLDGIDKNDKTHYYCLVMVLQKNDTYTVDEIFKSKENKPFPNSKLRTSFLQ